MATRRQRLGRLRNEGIRLADLHMPRIREVTDGYHPDNIHLKIHEGDRFEVSTRIKYNDVLKIYYDCPSECFFEMIERIPCKRLSIYMQYYQPDHAERLNLIIRRHPTRHLKICFRHIHSTLPVDWEHLLAPIPHSNVENLSIKFGYSRTEVHIEFPTIENLLHIVEQVNNSRQLKECYFAISMQMRDYINMISHLRPNGPLIERFEVWLLTGYEPDDYHELLEIMKRNHYLGELISYDIGSVNVVKHAIKMIGLLNRNGRIYMRDAQNQPHYNSKGCELLIKLKKNINATYFHLLENPQLCNIPNVNENNDLNIEQSNDNIDLDTKPPARKKSRISKET